MAKITLSTPILRKDAEPITTIELRKPAVGELRGLKLTDVLQMDVTAMLKLLPRITSPALDGAEVAALDPADFMGLAGRVVGFFMTPEEQRALTEQAS